jgi:hypothetical protein
MSTERQEARQRMTATPEDRAWVGVSSGGPGASSHCSSDAAVKSGRGVGGENPSADPIPDDDHFKVWYAFWQIEQEAESWLREHGDEDTMDFIRDRAEMGRSALEALTRNAEGLA